MSSVDPQSGWGASPWAPAGTQPEKPSCGLSSGDLPDADLVSAGRQEWWAERCKDKRPTKIQVIEVEIGQGKLFTLGTGQETGQDFWDCGPSFAFFSPTVLWFYDQSVEEGKRKETF